KLYRYLVPMTQEAWGALVVDSVLDRLEPSGIRSGDEAADEAVWGFWQDNALDAESKLAHNAALIDGRAHALVWPDESNQPAVSRDYATQMVIQYRPGSRRHRVAAMRRWVEGSRLYATLYRPDGIYKFQSKDEYKEVGRVSGKGVEWVRREV